MPKPYPKEFRDAVVRVAPSRQGGARIAVSSIKRAYHRRRRQARLRRLTPIEFETIMTPQPAAAA